ncbi:MAG: DinB family protein [Gemmatimonadaceae bacterium]|nr:DinB family protein [Gemmatimonadaceae bacterium]
MPTAPGALAAEARRIHAESVRYWSAYPLEAFFRRPGPDVWAPADQLRHLTKAIRAVNQGLVLPRLALLLLFGWSRRPSRSFDVLEADYKASLAGGGRAGRFAPAVLEAAEHTSGGRTRIMARHATAIETFARALDRWSDRALDRYRLPHPLLGKLTVREMAYFTLLHNVHHVAVAERRRSTG